MGSDRADGASELDELLERARDAAYTAVGFGVLAVQRAQVARRELAKDVRARTGDPEDVLAWLVKQAEVVVDPLLSAVEQRLPEPGRTILRQSRRAARGYQRMRTPPR